MNIITYYRTLSAEQKAYLAIANRKVDLGPTLEFLAYQAGLPANFQPHESEQLRNLAIARNVQFPRELEP